LKYLSTTPRPMHLALKDERLKPALGYCHVSRFDFPEAVTETDMREPHQP